MNKTDHSLARLLQAIIQTLNASEISYRKYLAEGKTYYFAKELKKYNSQVIELLTENRGVLIPSLQHDADKLLFHYKTWIEKWDRLAAEINPKDDDIFVFANEVTFPKDAAKNLEAAYLKTGLN